MNQRIIYQAQNGIAAVVIPTGELPIEQVLAKDVPAGVAAEIVDVSVIPSDRTFRNAWEVSDKAIQHNMTKAKAIAHERRRAARAEEFKPLDVEATIPTKAAQAEAARQIIRDKYAAMQANMDAAQTVEELKALLPSV
jgi:flagellar biosynthesis GTPase FlhF